VNPLKILYDHQVFAAQKYGGVSRLFYELLQNLGQKKEIRIYLFHGLYINRFPVKNIKSKTGFYFGHKIVSLPHIPVLLKPINKILFNVLAGKPVDIYHPTGYSSIVSNWKKSPVVLTVYDMIPELFPRDFPDIKSRLKNKQKSIERADKIITISETTKQDLLHFYKVDETKVSVVYPGVPVEPTGVTGKQFDLYKHEKPYLLYVGTRKQGYKNFDNLLLAYAISKKIHDEFDLICFGGPAFSGGEHELLSLFECLDNVYHFPGNDRDLAQLYTGAAAFIYPSLHEGFGLPPLEAMAYGCPVIASHVPVMREVLGDAAAYFEPRMPESIVSALETILFDETLRLDLIEKGKKQVRKYSWSKMAEEVLAVYKSLREFSLPGI
jgi:glycosyltransferase involved in cell wall biosynthesis